MEEVFWRIVTIDIEKAENTSMRIASLEEALRWARELHQQGVIVERLYSSNGEIILGADAMLPPSQISGDLSNSCEQ